MSALILRATHRNGEVAFYNGKAGPEWLSSNPRRAFGYEGYGDALHKANTFNRMEPIHGFRFEVVDLGTALRDAEAAMSCASSRRCGVLTTPFSRHLPPSPPL